MISKSSSECSIDQEAFSFSIDGKTRISDSVARTAKSKVSNNIGHIPHKLYNIQITLPYTYPHLTRDTSTYLYLHRQHFSLSLILTNCFIFMWDILYLQFHNWHQLDVYSNTSLQPPTTIPYRTSLPHNINTLVFTYRHAAHA